MKYQLDFKDIKNKKELHQYLKQELSFPDYYGSNLDALYDMLTCFEEGTTIEIINFSNFKNLEEKYCNMLMVLFDDVNNEQLGVDIKVIN